MKIKRQTTDSRVKALLSKDEPTYGFMELSGTELTLALNWYSQNKEKETAFKYMAEYCKAKGISAKTEQIEQTVSTVGFVCRMITRGAILDSKSLKWLAEHLKAMTLIPVEYNAPVAVAPVKVVSIQDRIKAKSSESIGLLEGLVDEFILSDFKKIPNILQRMRDSEVKASHGPHIVNFFKKYRDEIRLALAKTDSQISEGYSNYSTHELRKMDSLYDQIISDTLSIMGEANVEKSPRKKKIKSPEKQVHSLKYCVEDTALKIKSIPPTRMIGAEGVWVYNRKNRMLSCYMADDASGLGVKGCAFQNTSKTKCQSKKLRKPEETLAKVMTGGKVALKNLFESLSTKDAKPTGRTNKETLLLRVIV